MSTGVHSSEKMYDLFCQEMTTQIEKFNAELLDYEETSDPIHIKGLLQGAHSIKGAAQILGLRSVVQLAHEMEGILSQQDVSVDTLFNAVDVLVRVVQPTQAACFAWVNSNAEQIQRALEPGSSVTPYTPLGKDHFIRVNSEEIDRLVTDSGQLKVLSAKGKVDLELVNRLHTQLIKLRMRPFSDILGGLRRLSRNLCKELGKSVRFNVTGEETLVGRDILEKLETCLSHLIKNTLAHGIEDHTGNLYVDVAQNQDQLHVIFSDDGKGIDPKIVDKLFLEGFSTEETATTVSGRGVGLGAVRSILHEVGGEITVDTSNGQGATFHLELPLTLVVVRCVTVKMSGELVAFPMSSVERIEKVNDQYVVTLCGQDVIVEELMDQEELVVQGVETEGYISSYGMNSDGERVSIIDIQRFLKR